ncbi:MAG: 23S rRNA (guanosine(2251)-2'-O)-methyltransferase RlmB [Firmicutes bacterium]|nr:23S rRNA (guanosine(2251)-2'-O)-methyltransferase RlmB [Bacillota bacterium]
MSEKSGDTEVVAGRNAVRELLKAKQPIVRLYLAEGAHGGSIGEILALAKSQGVPWSTVPRAALQEMTAGGTHQGVAARIAAVPTQPLERFLERAQQDPPALFVALDAVQDPHNVGAIARSAEAAGADGLLLTAHGGAGLTNEVARAAAGALAWLPVARPSSLAQAILRFKEAGLWVVGADASAALTYDQVDWKQPTLLVLGSEGSGLSRLVKERCDLLARIPLYGQIASLNVSVAAALFLFAAARQREEAGYRAPHPAG